MSSEKVLHPVLVDTNDGVTELDNVANDAFYFMGPGYPMSLLQRRPGLEVGHIEVTAPNVNIVDIENDLPQILEEYPPIARLYVLEKFFRHVGFPVVLDESKQQKYIDALRKAYLDILEAHGITPLVASLIQRASILQDLNKSDAARLAAVHERNVDPQGDRQVIRRMILEGNAEDRKKIRQKGFIDAVRFPWNRNELYRMLEAAEKTDPAEFILHRYFDAVDSPNKGFYARRRLANYKAEAEQLPVEFKVEYILKNPSRAVGFFYDEQFIHELTNRRPDLFFKLINLKKLTTSDKFKGKLFVSPHGFAGKLVEAAAQVGTFEEIKRLESQIEGLGWTAVRYPTLREKIKEAKDKAKKAEKGKEEASVAVALRSHLTTAKVELSDIAQLDRVLKENQKCKKLEVYTPSAIFVVDFSQQQKKLSDKHAGIKTPISIYRADLETPLYLPAEYSIGICSVSTTYVSSDEFQQAYHAKVSPAEMDFKPVQLGFLARFGQWLSKAFSRTKKFNIAANAIKKEPVQITGKAVPLSTKKMKRIFSSSELSTSEKSGDTESVNSEDDVSVSNASDSGKLYQEARDAFVEGNYTVAIEKIRDCTYLILKMRKSSEDERSCVVNHLMGILQKTKANLLDYLMVDELMQQDMPDIGPLVSLRTAVVQLFGEFTLTESNFSHIPEQWRGPFQLFVLERQFLNLKNPNTIAYKREAVRLQEQYMAVLKEHQDMPLARVMAAKSRLVSYHQSSTEIAKSRVTVMNMFERDPKRLIEQMFDVLDRNELAEPSKFISTVIAKVGLDPLTSYVRDIYPKGLEILLQNSPYFRGLLFSNQLKLVGIIRNTTPQFRQILRKHLPSEFERAKMALHEAFTLDVHSVLNGTSSAEKMFSDPFFIDELEANPQQRELIFERDDLYAVYGKYGTKYHDVAILFQQYARNENPPEDSLTKVIAQAGMREVLNCIIGNCPYGLRILLEKYPAAREILKSKEFYLQALAGSDFPEVRHTLRQCRFELSEKVKEILARKMRKNIEVISDHEKAEEKLKDQFFVAELFVPENVEELKNFEAKFPGLLYRVAESVAQAQVRASSIPKPF